MAREEDDHYLMAQVAAGSSIAFAALYDKHAVLINSIAYKILNDSEEANDVVQQVFLKLHLKAGKFDSRLGNPIAWMSIVARNCALDRLRIIKRNNQYAEKVWTEGKDILVDDSAGNKNFSHHDDAVELLCKAVERLPADHRNVLELAYFGGLSHQEIAEKLNHPLGTVKARIRRALLKLRTHLEKPFDR